MALQGLRNWLAEFRRRDLKTLDRIERDLVVGHYERREFAGDPRQPRKFWVRTRNRR